MKANHNPEILKIISDQELDMDWESVFMNDELEPRILLG